MNDPFRDRQSAANECASYAVAVTPNDDTDLEVIPRGLYLGTSGDVTVTMISGQVVTFSDVTHKILPIRARRVHATGTTATGIVALW